MNMVKRSLGVISVLATVFVPAGPALAQHGTHSIAQTSVPAKVNETGAALRDLWVGHVFWVRNVVVSTIAGNQPAAAAAEQDVVHAADRRRDEPLHGSRPRSCSVSRRALRAVKQYLERRAGSQASRCGVKSLSGNATEIARCLSGANPNLPFDTLNGLLLAHGGHHVQQIQQVHSKQYADEAKTWEAMKKHMYVVSDALAGAIAKQFPKQFS